MKCQKLCMQNKKNKNIMAENRLGLLVHDKFQLVIHPFRRLFVASNTRVASGLLHNINHHIFVTK